MARKVQIQLTDDLDDSVIEDGKGGTVTFALDGVAYEIDLGEKNTAAFHKAFSKYVEAARKVGKVGKVNNRAGTGNVRNIESARSANGAARMDKEQATAIREWANSNGHTVADRGRIPAAVVEAYQTAHA